MNSKPPALPEPENRRQAEAEHKGFRHLAELPLRLRQNRRQTAGSLLLRSSHGFSVAITVATFELLVRCSDIEAAERSHVLDAGSCAG